VLKGEQKIALRRQAEKRKGKAASRKIDAALGEGEHALFEKLRAWRADTAKQHGVPAYVVLHDSTLIALAKQRPQSLAALGQVSGIGAHKLDNYGQALLQVLAA
jgi:ATP-dependent DNA helicase RecQ